MEEEEGVREATTSEKSHMIVGIAFGLTIGLALFLASLGADTGSQTQISFEEKNLSHRVISLETRHGDRLDCDVSRFDEVQISRSAYVYRNASCESWMLLNDTTVSVPVEVEVLFDAEDLRIGFEFEEEHVICDVSEKRVERAGVRSVVYSRPSCTGWMGSLYGKWNDPGFENFNVHERGQELAENRSSE